jgi:SAM-dependent methyltransferase
MAIPALDHAGADRASDPVDSEWAEFWRGHSVESEIGMGDFYGLRHVLLKFLPRHGTVLEAGCGLARYVFYLRALGWRAIGCERLLPALATGAAWARSHRPESAGAFAAADVRRLPFRDQSLAGYVSLGVIEHFPEGPEGAVREAYRVLQPGGIAVIEVPSAKSYDLYLHRLKRAAGWLLGRSRSSPDGIHEQPLAPEELGSLLRAAGFSLLFCNAVDVVYPAWSLGLTSRWYPALHGAEETKLTRWGGLAVAVGIKRDRQMACFVCGQSAEGSAELAVPWCHSCRATLPTDVTAWYSSAHITEVRWQALALRESRAAGKCSFCGGPVVPDDHFADWGFSVPVCAECVRRPPVNLSLARRAMKRVWRARPPRPSEDVAWG